MLLENEETLGGWVQLSTVQYSQKVGDARNASFFFSKFRVLEAPLQ